MVTTPWGDSETLRKRKLQPARGVASEDVSRHQRERVFAAIVASIAEHGYAATSVSRVIALSGISSKAYYELFPDKSSALRATVEAILAEAEAAEPAGEDGDVESWARSRFLALAEGLIAQPAAARLCLLESFADPGGDGPIEDFVERHSRRLAELHRERGQDIPERLVRARVDGILEVIYNKLRTGTESELPLLADEIASLVASDTAPPESLRLATRPPKGVAESRATADHADRAIRAFAVLVAEKGYVATTVEDVLRAASMSPATFNANFAGKEDLMTAAIDTACAHAVAAGSGAFAAQDDWASALRTGLGASLNFLASRPALANLVMVEVYAAGVAAIERRNRGLVPLAALVENNTLAWAPKAPVIYEATAGAIYRLLRSEVKRHGPDALPALAPDCTFLALAPFLGPNEATAVANESGSRVGSVERRPISRISQPGSGPSQTLAWMVAEDETTAEELAERMEVDVATVEGRLEELIGAGLVKRVSGDQSDGSHPRYQPVIATLRAVVSARQLSSMTEEEREEIAIDVWEVIASEVEAALRTKTFTKRVDHHQTRVPLTLDEEGWREIVAVQTEALQATFEIQARAEKRLGKSGGEQIRARSIQLLFEAPADKD